MLGKKYASRRGLEAEAHQQRRHELVPDARACLFDALVCMVFWTGLHCHQRAWIWNPNWDHIGD